MGGGAGGGRLEEKNLQDDLRGMGALEKAFGWAPLGSALGWAPLGSALGWAPEGGPGPKATPGRGVPPSLRATDGTRLDFREGPDTAH